MNILTAIDFFDSTDRIITVTRNLALATNATVRLVHVAEPEPDFVGYGGGPNEVRDQIAVEFQREHNELQTLSAQLRDVGIDASALVVQGPIAETILSQAKSHATDLIIVGSHGHGAVYDILVGSISEGVIRKSNIPVTIVPVSDTD